MENTLKVVFFGTPKEVVPVLENLDKHFSVVGVITAPDKPVGRKQIMTPSPVKGYAEAHTIPVLQPTTLKTSTDEIKALGADLYVVAAYGKIIPEEILAIPQYGAINIHPSLLPRYRSSSSCCLSFFLKKISEVTCHITVFTWCLIDA